tara:strand:+ start:5876 stop:6604 length:729 start_codon:yes stop_codon:yes gene_type:complete
MEIGIASPNEKEKMMQMKRYEAQAGPLAPQQPGVMQQAGDMVKNRAMNKGLNYGEEKLVEAFTPSPVVKPTAGQMTQANALSTGAEADLIAAGQGMGVAPSLATAGATTSAAPIIAGGIEGGAVLGASTAPVVAGAGGAGMAATVGTAMPYIGAAMLADQALGLGIMDSLFSEGGKVGPLSPEYKMSGGPLGMGALSMYQDMMKKNMKSEGGPITPEYKMGGGPLGMGALSMYHDMMKKNMR